MQNPPKFLPQKGSEQIVVEPEGFFLKVQQNSALMVDSNKTLLNNSNYWVGKGIS